MARSMVQQLTYPIRKTTAFGESKHSDKGQGSKGVRHDGRSYSYGTFKGRLDTAKQFGSYMERQHPEIKLAREITRDHINDFLITKAETCRNDTLRTYSSNLRSLCKEIDKTYHCKLGIKERDIVTPTVEREPIRTVAMDKEDFARLRESYTTDSLGDRALALERACGGRCEELVTIKGKDIFIEHDRAIVHIEQGKGGRERDVYVKDKDSIRELAHIKEITRDNERVCPIKKDSLHRSLERHMKDIGIKHKYPNTSVHAMRKEWAQRIYDQCRAEGMSKLQAIQYVNDQLGHGKDRDVLLLGRYVQNMH